MSTTTDYTWTPDPKTGISREKPLLSDLENHVEDIEAAHRPGVYALEYSTPNTTDKETYIDLWTTEFDVTPGFIHLIAERSRLLYVGAATDVYERLQEHLATPNRSSTLSTVFPIHSIYDITFTNSADKAFEREYTVASTLSREITDAYIHSR
jgi:predicted GIY-YIG superfamily endonuclease